jgi:hypothetical protein
MLKLSGTNRQRAATLLMAVLCLVVVSQAVVLAQNLGAAPQVNVAVRVRHGAQKVRFLTWSTDWQRDRPVGAGLALPVARPICGR